MKARLPQGYGSKGMNDMLKQAQKMQEDMASLQEELAQKEYSASSGGSMVEATVRGDKSLASLSIKPEVVDPEDVEMLEDMIVAAINEAHRIAEEDASELMGKITGGMDLPGLI
ncbi:MAG: YbaB/EbfC family nucleoid-associated protein [Oscillospiraceae bacterium]|nr:YbaB/EbfC family nucleoid-associated protein [Oscillospiraceae bacterium]